MDLKAVVPHVIRVEPAAVKPVSVTPDPVGAPVVLVTTPGSPLDPNAIADAVSGYLTANPVLPSQSGHAGNFLSTDGVNPSWMDITPPVTLILLLDNALA